MNTILQCSQFNINLNTTPEKKKIKTWGSASQWFSYCSENKTIML